MNRESEYKENLRGDLGSIPFPSNETWTEGCDVAIGEAQFSILVIAIQKTFLTSKATFTY